MSNPRLPAKDSLSLSAIRRRIDRVDDKLLELLRSRKTLIDEIAEIKAAQQLEMNQPKRYVQVMRRITKQAKAVGLDPELVRIIWNTLHMYSVEQQENRLKDMKDRSWLHKTTRTRIKKS